MLPIYAEPKWKVGVNNTISTIKTRQVSCKLTVGIHKVIPQKPIQPSRARLHSEFRRERVTLFDGSGGNNSGKSCRKDAGHGELHFEQFERVTKRVIG